MLLPRKFADLFEGEKVLKKPVFCTVCRVQVMKQRGIPKGSLESPWKRQNRARYSEHEILY